VIPSEAEALGIHKNLGSDQVIVAHCREVRSVAKLIAQEFRVRGFQVDVDAIAAGALLHDIGRTKTHAVLHGYEGAEILRGLGVDGKVVEIVKRHVGAGISEEEARSLGFPPGDYVPRSLEERIVCFADKIVAKDGLQRFAEEVKRFTRKGHDVRRLLELRDGLRRELGEDPEALVLARIKDAN
jgi:uncharacterized protein